MLILALVALLPPFYMMYLIFRMDKVEREPVGLIVRICLLGAVMSIPVIIAESIMGVVIGSIFASDSVLGILIENIIGVALIEEFAKYIASRRIWKNPNFNYRFDGVVYCVAASIGFAALENLLYVYSYGLSTGLIRAVTSIPGHTVFGIYMGIYFGEAKLQEVLGNRSGYKQNIRKALWVPTLIHGFYDALLSFDSGLTSLLFLVLLIAVYVATIRKIRRFQRQDIPFTRMPRLETTQLFDHQAPPLA